jgi:hypothetical protein
MSQMLQQHGGEIIVAIIGLIGVLVTALLSNWDTLFGNVVRASYSPEYTPTKNFETELRIFFEVSGVRATLESAQKNILQNQRIELLTKYSEKAEIINKEYDAIADEAITLDEAIKALLPVYRKYLTIDEIQQLNKFYFTDVMQGLTSKMPMLAQEAAPIQAKLVDTYLQRLSERLKNMKPRDLA